MLVRILGEWLFGLARGRQRSEVSTCCAAVPPSYQQATMVSPPLTNLPLSNPSFTPRATVQDGALFLSPSVPCRRRCAVACHWPISCFLRHRRVRLPRRAGVVSKADIEFGVVVRASRPSRRPVNNYNVDLATDQESTQCEVKSNGP